MDVATWVFARNEVSDGVRRRREHKSSRLESWEENTECAAGHDGGVRAPVLEQIFSLCGLTCLRKIK